MVKLNNYSYIYIIIISAVLKDKKDLFCLTFKFSRFNGTGNLVARKIKKVARFKVFNILTLKKLFNKKRLFKAVLNAFKQFLKAKKETALTLKAGVINAVSVCK